MGVDGTVVSYNLFAYCGNNPVMGYDPTGQWDWGKFWDVVTTAVAAAAGIGVGVAVGVATASPLVGVAAGVATTGAVNNAVNAVYYEFSDGESEIGSDSYRDEYVSRWERIDYTKHETQEDHYNLNAWRYYSEYSAHMYGWYATGWAYKTKIPIVSGIAERCYDAHVVPGKPDGRWQVELPTAIVGILGL